MALSVRQATYQCVRTSITTSTSSLLECGVPQGSVLGPILFLLYAADVLQLHPHVYADDSQIYGFCRPLQTVSQQDRISACIDYVSLWMRANWLQLNPSKTEVLWCSSASRQHQVPSTPLRIGSTAISPVSPVRDLGVRIDSDLAMRSHVVATVRSSFAALRQIRSVRRSLTPQALLTLVRVLVVSKVD